MNLRKLGSKLFDQANPFDNGRTYQNQTPTNTRSVIGQIAHNGVTNTLGNFTVKPVASTAKVGVENARRVVAVQTHNQAANQAAQQRINQNWGQSVPGFLTSQAHGVADVVTSLPKAVMADIHGFQGKAPTASEQAALNKGLKGLHQTTVGQMVSPAESIINSTIPGAKEASAAAGYDVNGSFAKKFLADPVMGTVGTYGLLKGGAAVTKAGAKAPVALKAAAADVVAGRQIKAALNDAGSVPGKKIPVTDVSAPVSRTVVSRIPIKTKVTGQELVDRYNAAMADLSRKYGRSQVPLTTAGKMAKNGKPGTQGIISEPSIYQDAGYLAEKQKIDQAYKDGTLAKIIPVKDAPKAKVFQKTTTDNPHSANGTGRPLTQDPALLSLKLNNVKDPVRRQELIAEAQAKAGQPAAPPPEVPSAQVPYTAPDTPSAMVAPKAPNMLDKTFVSASGLISKFGSGGKEIAGRLEAARNRSETGQEAFISKTPSVWSLSRKDMQLFADTLKARSEGRVVTAPRNIMQAVVEWNRAIPEIRAQALKAGIDVGDLGPNYFPQIHKGLFTRESKMMDMANKMVRDGKAETTAQALDAIQHMGREYIHGNGNLDMSRVADLAGYEKTHDALASYLGRAFDSISKAEQFGPKEELLKQMMDTAAQEGHNIATGGTLDKAVKVALGNNNHDTFWHHGSSFIRKVNALRSLNTAAISNASQLTNTATVAGLARTVKGAAKAAFDPEARAYAKSTGVELDHSINNLAASQLGTTGVITRNIASPFFHKIERFNRTATAIVGKDYGDMLAKKGDHAELQRLGVKGEIGSELTPEQTVQISRGLVRHAQFKVDPMDLPMWADSPLGKLAAQFRTFGYKQTGFMWNEVLRKAMDGNFAPLARFTATSIPVGSAQLALKGAIKGNPLYAQNGDGGVDKKGQVVNAVGAVGGFGLPGSEVQNFYNSSKYGDPITAAENTLGGPTASIINEVKGGIQKGKNGDWSKLEKTALRSVPVVGPAAANRVFPKKENKPVNSSNISKASLADIEAQKKSDIANYKKKNSSDGYGLTQMDSGNYVYHIGGDVKTTRDLKQANEDISMDVFKKSKQDELTVGDRHYYKDENGQPKKEWTFKHEYDVATSQNEYDMTVAKDDNNPAGWWEAATKQLDALTTARDKYNQKGQKDEVNKKNKAIETLTHTMEKYKSYGGFTKGGGSGGGSGKNDPTANPFKYGVSLKAGGSVPASTKVAKVSSALKYKAALKSSPSKISVKKSKV